MADVDSGAGDDGCVVDAVGHTSAVDVAGTDAAGVDGAVIDATDETAATAAC